MANQNEIIKKIDDIKKHFDKNLNNKYVKNILLRLDLSNETKHSMGLLLDYKNIYFDSKGTIEDIYHSIKAIAFTLREVQIKAIPNLGSFSYESFFTSANHDNNDKILFQMAIKNYPMNVKILAKMSLELLKMVIQYDRENFTANPVVDSFKNFEEIVNALKSTVEQE
jgi:hypothetical protein